jgi:hypothetical protein
MLSMLFATALSTVLTALFLSSLGRAKASHVIIAGILAAASLMWLIASIVSVSR